MAVVHFGPPNDAPPTSEPTERRQEGPGDEPGALKPRRFRLLWLALGWLFFGLGFIGVFLPILPTTGFWILAVVAFERSNPKIAARIRNSPRFGPGVAAFLDHGVISRRGKTAALAAMALSAVILALLTQGPGLWFGLGGIAIGAAYVGSRPSTPRNQPPSETEDGPTQSAGRRQ